MPPPNFCQKPTPRRCSPRRFAPGKADFVRRRGACKCVKSNAATAAPLCCCRVRARRSLGKDRWVGDAAHAMVCARSRPFMSQVLASEPTSVARYTRRAASISQSPPRARVSSTRTPIGPVRRAASPAHARSDGEHWRLNMREKSQEHRELQVHHGSSSIGRQQIVCAACEARAPPRTHSATADTVACSNNER